MTARVSSSSTAWVGVAPGIWGWRLLGVRRLEAVEVAAATPLVVAGAADAKAPAGRGHVAGALDLGEQGDAAVVDNVGGGHGGGLLSFLVETTESTTGPSIESRVQPQPWDRKG